MKIGILCSGRLGYEALKKLYRDYTCIFVLTDNSSKDIIEFSHKNDLPILVGNPRNDRGYRFIKLLATDIIISINYLYLIEKDIFNHANLMAFNIHGSLLPKYRGRTPHVWAIINNETVAGITAHQIDSGCDTGMIIDQLEIPIDPMDTGQDMIIKYQKAYYPFIISILSQLKLDKVKLVPQNHNKATLFQKRTAADGLINWNWSKERIRNWVRAQSYPYPGAFTNIHEKRIVIDEITYSDHGYQNWDPNGLIMQDKPQILVKTPNGIVILSDIRNNSNLCIKGRIFNS